MKKFAAILLSGLLLIGIFGETPETPENNNETINAEIQEVVKENDVQVTLPPENTEPPSTDEKAETDFSQIREIELANIPAYSSKSYAIINNNVPFFPPCYELLCFWRYPFVYQ